MPEDTRQDRFLDYLEHIPGSIVCSNSNKEALGHDYDEPKQWGLREINDIMNNAVTRLEGVQQSGVFSRPYTADKGLGLYQE